MSRNAGIRERHRVAYHEAGHAVVAALVGVSLEGVTIAADSENLGHNFALWDAETVASIEGGLGLPPRVAEDHIMVSFAGKLTEELIFGEALRGGSRTDLDDVAALALEIGPRHVSEPRVHELREATHQLVRTAHAREAIEVVASALLERETLTGSEVYELVGRAATTMKEGLAAESVKRGDDRGE